MKNNEFLYYHTGLVATDLLKELRRIAVDNKPQEAECWKASIVINSESLDAFIDIRYTKNGVMDEIKSLWHKLIYKTT